MSEDIRKLVTVRQIAKIEPIEGADAIEAAYVGGWASVVKKNQFAVGDSVLFFEIDAFLPANVEEFAFLMTRGTRKIMGADNVEVEGTILRTMKLRGQISQGLILPLSFGLTAESTQEEVNTVMSEIGVFKYEKPLPASGLEIAEFPGLIRKTDSERVQNLSDEFLQSLDPTEWVATEKIDGTSSTFWKTEDGVLHAASRNWEISLDNQSAYSRMAELHKLDEIIPVNGFIQAEIYGEGIQGNPLKIQGVKLAVFSHGLLKDNVIAHDPIENTTDVLSAIKLINPHLAGTVIEDILSDPDGFIIHHEQIFEIAKEIAGMTPQETDDLRMAMAKGKEDILEELRPVFFAGALKNGYGEEETTILWDGSLHSAKYAFHKSHVVASRIIEIQQFEDWATENMAPTVPLTFPESVSEAIAQVDGMKSHYNKNAQSEGVVWWNKNGKTFNETGGRANFKSINNKFLIKHGG